MAEAPGSKPEDQGLFRTHSVPVKGDEPQGCKPQDQGLFRVQSVPVKGAEPQGCEPEPQGCEPEPQGCEPEPQGCEPETALTKHNANMYTALMLMPWDLVAVYQAMGRYAELRAKTNAEYSAEDMLF